MYFQPQANCILQLQCFMAHSQVQPTIIVSIRRMEEQPTNQLKTKLKRAFICVDIGNLAVLLLSPKPNSASQLILFKNISE